MNESQDFRQEQDSRPAVAETIITYVFVNLLILLEK